MPQLLKDRTFALGTGIVTFTDGYVDVYYAGLDEPVALS